MHTVEVPSIAYGTQEFSLHWRFREAFPELNLVRDVRFHGECHRCPYRPYVHVYDRWATVLVWKELGPVFTNVEAERLDEVCVRCPIRIELSDDWEMAEKKRMLHDWLLVSTYVCKWVQKRLTMPLAFNFLNLIRALYKLTAN